MGVLRCCGSLGDGGAKREDGWGRDPDQLDDRRAGDRAPDLQRRLDHDALGDLLVDQLLQRDRARNSTILALGWSQRSCVMQGTPSPRQLCLPLQPVASIGSSTEVMMSATVISSALRPACSHRRAPGRLDQVVATQLAEQLLEVEDSGSAGAG